MNLRLAAAGCLLLLLGPGQVLRAASPDDIVNYREYSATLSSSGQPSAAQLESLQAAGFERVVFLAFSDHEGGEGREPSLANEDRLVRELGMDYAHLPVIWEQPTRRDFYAFAAVMQRQPSQRTLVHCQVNFRASTFSFLYRVLHEDVPVATAKEDMNTVWVPNATWQALIFEILEENGVSPHCDTCLWDNPD